LDNQIEKIQEDIKQREAPLFSMSHLHDRQRSQNLGASLFEYRQPSVIGKNKTIVGSSSVLDRFSKKPAPNKQVKSTGGFCSIFGFGAKK
jgi:hypothetical protein